MDASIHMDTLSVAHHCRLLLTELAVTADLITTVFIAFVFSSKRDRSVGCNEGDNFISQRAKSTPAVVVGTATKQCNMCD